MKILSKGSSNSDPSVKRVFIRKNNWDNWGVFVGTKKVFDGADYHSVLERVSERYPNAKVIIKK